MHQLRYRVKHLKQPDWLNEEVLLAMKNRDTYKVVGDEDAYKLWRNKVVPGMFNQKVQM